MAANNQHHLDALQDIRNLMERSSRFISLSGLSGVAAGASALLGAAGAYLYLGALPFSGGNAYYELAQKADTWGMDFQAFFLLDALLVFMLACFSAIYFTTRRAKKQGQQIWGPLTRRLLLSLAIPLISGGIFVVALYQYGILALIAPSTLIFYGLALINSSKYTIGDIHYLGISELFLGLIGLFRPGFGLELWTLGFGVLHILYGILMYRKYERPATINEQRLTNND